MVVDRATIKSWFSSWIGWQGDLAASAVAWIVGPFCKPQEGKMRSNYRENVLKIRREAWVIIAGAAASGFAFYGIEGAILNLFLLRMGYGPEVVGTVMAVAALGFALAALPAAAAGHWLGVRRAMIVGVLGWVGASVALSLADMVPAPWRQPWILAMRLIGVGCLSLYGVNSTPYLTGVTTAEERPHAFALLGSLNPLGAFVGSLVGGLLLGLLATVLGTSLELPRPFGYALAAGNLVYVPVIWALFSLDDDRPRDTSSQVVRDRSAVPYAVLGMIGLVCVLRVGGEFSARTFFNVYMDSSFSASAARIGAVMAVANLLSIPAPLATPPLVQRLGRIGTVAGGALGVAACIALLGFSGQWVVAALAFVGTLALAAMARSVWLLAILESVRPEWRPTASGVSNLASGLGASAMSVVGGYMVAGLGYRPTFVTGAVLVALGALVVWCYFGMSHPAAAPHVSGPEG